jgi:hypothetical protein
MEEPKTTSVKSHLEKEKSSLKVLNFERVAFHLIDEILSELND